MAEMTAAPGIEVLNSSETRYVHNGGNDVEALYSAPEGLGDRAVRLTGAGSDAFINPDILCGGLKRMTDAISARVKRMETGDLTCANCKGGCGLGQQTADDRDAGTVGTMGFFLRVGVDRQPLEERRETDKRRPDRPDIVASLRCYSALQSATDENRGTRAEVVVENLPEGMQFDVRCQAVMDEIARAAFNLFRHGLSKLPSSPL